VKNALAVHLAPTGKTLAPVLEGHIRILGIRDNEGAGGGIGFDFGELGVERFHLRKVAS
jgi:hypothetical protein